MNRSLIVMVCLLVTTGSVAGCSGKSDPDPEADAGPGVDGGPDVDSGPGVDGGPDCQPGDCVCDPAQAGCEDVVVMLPNGDTFTEDNSIFTGAVIEGDSITLSADVVINEVIWIANSLEGSISKIDTTTHEELGRYYTGPALVETTTAPVDGECPDGYEERDAKTCVMYDYTSWDKWAGPGQNPSRTSVDRFGNAYVANRSWNWAPSVTKINHRCAARDEVAGLVTWAPDGDDELTNNPPPLQFRRDTNGSLNNPWDDTYTWDDDCIVFHTVAALDPLDRMDSGTEDEADDYATSSGSLGRGMALQEVEGEDGLFHTFGWLASYNLHRYYEFDGETGELTGRVIHFPSCTSYGAAIDRFGVLWSSCLSGVIGRADTRLRLADDDLPDEVPDVPVPGTVGHCLDAAGEDTEFTCIEGEDISILGNSSYGITVAPAIREGDPLVRVFIASSTVTEYIPPLEDGAVPIWINYATGSGNGIGVDREGIVWTNTDYGSVGRANPYRVPFDPLTGLPDVPTDWSGAYQAPAEASTMIPTGRGGRGVGVATDGYIWIVNWDHYDELGPNDGNVTLIDPHPAEDADQDGDPDVAGPEEYLDGTCCEEIKVSYTYSDMTGFQYTNATVPLGEFRFFVPGCGAGTTTWGDITIAGDFPAGTSLRVQVKLVDDLVDLANDEDWVSMSLEDGGGDVMDDTHPPGGNGGTFLLPDLEGGEPNLGLRATMTAEDRADRPALSSIQLGRACE